MIYNLFVIPKKRKHEFTNFSVLQNGFLNPLKWKNKAENVLIHHEGFKMLSSLFSGLWIRKLKKLWICDIVFLMSWTGYYLNMYLQISLFPMAMVMFMFSETTDNWISHNHTYSIYRVQLHSNVCLSVKSQLISYLGLVLNRF